MSTKTQLYHQCCRSKQGRWCVVYEGTLPTTYSWVGCISHRWGPRKCPNPPCRPHLGGPQRGLWSSTREWGEFKRGRQGQMNILLRE